MLIKRLFDIVCSFLGLLILAPVFLVIILLIKLTSEGPIFFRQTRVGQHQKLFQIHKFRTMIVNAEANGLKITIGRDSRITWIGAILRKTKLDELPQLIDVLLGDMSLVGPRPEVPEYVKYYSAEMKAVVFKVKPGITDKASIEMIDENEVLSKYNNPEQAYIEHLIPLKLSYAVRYVNEHSLAGDILIIFKTIAKIFTR